MPYIGTSPSQGVRRVHTYTATANQTSFSGAGAEGATLSYKDSNFVDVYQNGVKLGDADYTATSGTSIVLGTGATVSDLVVIVAYDVFSAADTVSKADGGQFDDNVTFSGDIIKSTAGTSNFAAGINAGNSIQSGGNYNTVVGDEAGTALTTGDENVMIGYVAGDAINTSSQNVAVGAFALTVDTKGSKSVAIGRGTLNAQNFTSATDSHNVAVGDKAGYAITTGTQNTIIGSLAGDAMTDADGNVAVGYAALTTNVLGSDSVAIGKNALNAQNPASATAMLNVAVGKNAGEAITTGTQNVIVGGQAGDALLTGANVVAVGYNALSTDTKGFGSVANRKSSIRKSKLHLKYRYLQYSSRIFCR